MTDSAPPVVIPHARFVEYQARHRSRAAQSAERDHLRTILMAEPDAPVTSDYGTSERFAEAVHILEARTAPSAWASSIARNCKLGASGTTSILDGEHRSSLVMAALEASETVRILSACRTASRVLMLQKKRDRRLCSVSRG